MTHQALLNPEPAASDSAVDERAPNARRQDDRPRVDVGRLLDDEPIRRGHVVTTAILFGVLLIDGYDLHVTSQILPTIAAAFGVATASVTSAFAAQPLGQALGGVLLGPLADKLGRKRALLLLLCCFAAATAVSVLATTVQQFAITRFIAGALGGGLLPAAASLAADISSRRRRSAVVGIVYAGLGVGPLVAAGLVAGLLERIGWQGLYAIGALAPLLITVPILWWAPESPLHLVRRGAPSRDVASALGRLGVPASASAEFVLNDAAPARAVSVLDIFRDGRAAFTLVLWATCVSGLVSVTMLGLSATFFHEFAQVPLAQFAKYAAAAGVTTIIAGFSTGFMMDRFGRYAIVSCYALLAVVSLVALPTFAFGSAAFMIALICAGFFTWGSFQGLNILTPIIYPPHLRSAAVGWKGCVSRLGSSAAPLIGGALLSAHVGLQTAMTVSAAPLLLVALLVPLLARLSRRMEPACPAA